MTDLSQHNLSPTVVWSKVRVNQVLKTWQKRMGQQHWRVNVIWDDALLGSDTTSAMMSMSTDYDDATLILSHSIQRMGVKEMNVTILHEVIHLVLNDLSFFAEMLDGHLHRDIDSMLRTQWSHDVERVTDRLAWSLVEKWGTV